VKKYTVFITFLMLSNLSGLNSQSLKSDTIDVINYNIQLDLRYLSLMNVYGNTLITAVPAMASVSSFSLDFRKLQIDSLFLGHQLYLNFTYNDSVIRINLPFPAQPTDTIKLRVFYHGTPLIEPYNWGGFHFLPDSTLAFNLGVAFKDYPHNYGRIWFPCLDDFIDRATYDIAVRTKPNHKAVCGGMLLATLPQTDGSIVWQWQLTQPIPTYLASVAVGEFSVLSGSYSGIAGFIPSLIFVRPQDSTKAIGTFSNLNLMMSVFESRFGAYRWPRIGYVGTTKGAMEHATNIAFPRTSITGNHSSDWLIAHELSHHWFGDLVTCSSAEDMWINEGWARYSEALFFEGSQGWASYKSYMMGIQKDVLNFAHTNSSGDGSYLPLYPVPQTYTYGTTVYDKGALVAHTLRGYLGDSLFFNGIKALLTHFAFQPVSSYQMRDYLSQQTGINLTPFFDGWVFTPGFPHFSIDSVSSIPFNNGWNVTIHVKQKMTGRSTLTQDNRVEIGFCADRNTMVVKKMMFSGATGQQTFFLPFNPVAVLMDPEDRLSDAITAQTAYISSTGTTQFGQEFFKLNTKTVTDTIFLRIEHSFAPPDPLPQPVAGLTISPNRYWKLTGLIPQGCDLEGLFSYSTSNLFDNALINNTNDSLVILYRSNPGMAWSGIPFSKSPSATTGIITVSNLAMGEYVLAKWDEAYIGIGSLQPLAPKTIFPNPATSTISIYSENFENQMVTISSLEGKLIFSKMLTMTAGVNQLDITAIPDGIFLLEISDSNGVRVRSERIAICR
jgi:hypothetical protein